MTAGTIAYMWLGISDGEKGEIERERRLRCIEASDDCLGLGCNRFVDFLHDAQNPAGEEIRFALDSDHHREIRRISRIVDHDEMLRAFQDMFRGLGLCAVFMATNRPLQEVKASIAPDDCVPLSVRMGISKPVP